PSPTREEWLGRVETVLKGADFRKRLVSTTYDGIAIEPLYPKAEDAPLLSGRGAAPWRISQRVDAHEPETANALAHADLEGGADSLILVMETAPSARGFGLPLTADALDRALAGIDIGLIHLRLDA